MTQPPVVDLEATTAVPTTRGESRISLVDVVAVATIVVFGAVVPLLIARHYHALGVPRGDDWSYLRTLFHWVDTGHLNFNHWVTMTLVGQLVLAAPIALVHARDTSSVQILTAVLGVVGLLATVWVARACGVGRGASTFLAVIITAGPFFGVLAVSFMTDVPAFGCSMLSLALGLAALARRPISLPWLTASLAVGLLAFSIREYAAIPVVAVVLTAIYALATTRDTRRLRIVLLVAALTVVAALAVYAWVRTIPDPKPFPLGFPTSHAISTANVKGAGMLRLAGFWLLPALLFAGPIAMVRRAWNASRVLTRALAALAGAWLVVTGVAEPRNAFTGNYFIPEGALGQGVGSGTRPRLVPLHVFELFVAAGTVGAIVLVLAAVPATVAVARNVRHRAFPVLEPEQLAVTAVTVALLTYAVGYGVAALAGLPLYDRYTLPIVPLVGALVLRGRRAARAMPADGDGRSVARTDRWRSWRFVTAGLALALLFAIGLDYAADSASYDGARWRVSQAAVRNGWSPRQIGGNFEWVNFYTLHPGTPGRSRELCVLVSVGNQQARRTVVATGTYRPPFRDSVPVVAYRTSRPCFKGGKPSPP